MSVLFYRQGLDTFSVREAGPHDRDAIAQIKSLTWPDEPVRRERISEVLADPGHHTLIAWYGEAPAGFIDAFITEESSVQRWEVDLLAVAPAFRGRRLGDTLIEQSCRRAGASAVRLCRALIEVNNTPSRISFERSGFESDGSIFHLYVSDEALVEVLEARREQIEVTTLNYRGIWILPPFHKSDLLNARGRLQSTGSDLVGAVIPAAETQACRQAAEMGYGIVGAYQWWQRDAIAG